MRLNITITHLATFLFPMTLFLLLSACNILTTAPTPNPTATPTEPAGTADSLMTTSAPTSIVTNVAQPTQAALPSQTPVSIAEESTPSVMVDVSGMAQDVTSLIVAAVPPNTSGPWWETMPQYTLLTLEGYPITNHRMKPQIFIYPVKDLGVNEVALKVTESLQALLQNQQADQNMPFLPLNNEKQVMHAQVKYLDSKNSTGIRFLTEYDQAVLPVNNHELLYTYQGLSKDGKYYVAAVLPVNLPGLPADENATDNLPSDFMNNFPKYLADTVNMLNQQPPSAYMPDLSDLDAMMQSIEIK